MAVGRDDHGLRRRAARGELVPLAPGTYLERAAWDAAGPRERHLLRVHAVLPRLGGDLVVSHESALALHGFPLLGAWPSQVHVVDRRRRRTLSSRTLVRHAVPLPPADVASTGRWSTTTPVRSALDVARRRDLRGAVVLLDHGLHVGAFSLEEARRGHESRRSSPGSRGLAVALDLAAAAAESPGESLSRVGMWHRGLAGPVLQHEFRDSFGVLLGRVDFWWPCCGVVGEFDGDVKYLGRRERGDRPPEQVALDEKTREDRIRALPQVRGFARWDWADALAVEPMIARLHAAGLAHCTHA